MADSLLPDPAFAHRAADLMAQSQFEEAAEVCRAGIRIFPWYATGFLLLGSCYQAQGKIAEAASEYRNALQIHPDNYALHRLVASLNRPSQEVEVQLTPSPTPAAEPTPVVEEAPVQVSAPVTEQSDENGVEFLIRRLQEAKTAPSPVAAPSSDRQSSRATVPSSRIVTVTLAEIYAHQGEYAEAARAYRRLIEQRPEEADRFERRAIELEELANMKRGSMGGG